MNFLKIQRKEKLKINENEQNQELEKIETIEEIQETEQVLEECIEEEAEDLVETGIAFF